MIIEQLAQLAGMLDAKGMTQEADRVDAIIHRLAEGEKEYTYSISYKYAVLDSETGEETDEDNGFEIEDQQGRLVDIVKDAKDRTYNWEKSEGGWNGTATSDDFFLGGDNARGEKWTHKSWRLEVEGLDQATEQGLDKDLL